MSSSGQATSLILVISFAASAGGAFVGSVPPSAKRVLALTRMTMKGGSEEWWVIQDEGGFPVRKRGWSQRAEPGPTPPPDGVVRQGGGSRRQGQLKFFDQAKGFGFVSPAGGGESVFLHMSEIQGSTEGLVAGAELFFYVREDRTGRMVAAGAELVGGAGVVGAAAGMTRLPCFSMSQPFASLLLYGHTTVESRTTNMFEGVEGRVAVHVGRRAWKDTAYRARLREAGLSYEEIGHACALPKGFAAGDIIGTVVVGATSLGSRAESGSPAGPSLPTTADPSRQEDIGKFLTAVSQPKWFQRGVQASGRPGVWQVDVPTDLLA